MTEGKHRALHHHRLRWALLVVVVVAALALGGWATWYQPWADSSTPAEASAPLPEPVTDDSLSAEGLTGKAPSDRSAITAESSKGSEVQFPEGTGVHVIGDSLAVGIAEPLSLELAPRVVTIEAAEGRGTATSVALLSDHAYATAPIWLVSLGTNDNIEDFASQAEALMQLAGKQRCVLWFDVWRPNTQDSINADLAELVQRHSNLYVMPWYELSSQNPEWFDGEDVHPDDFGYAERTRMAAEAVAEHCTS